MAKCSTIFVAASCALALIGCSKQNVEVNKAKLVGKWRSEKTDTGPIIEDMKRNHFGMPEHALQPIIEKVRQGGELTEDWEFKADGTAAFGPTRQQPWPITWRIVKSRGDKAIVELYLDPSEPTTAEIVFQGDNSFSMRWLEEDEDIDEPGVIYNRVP